MVSSVDERSHPSRRPVWSNSLHHTSCVDTDDDDRIFNESPTPDISTILGTDPYCFDIESKKSQHTFWSSPFASESSDLAEYDSIISGAGHSRRRSVFVVGRNIILLY
jgi:hypothetical protein